MAEPDPENREGRNSDKSFTELLHRLKGGSPDTRSRFMNVAYAELRRLAAHYMAAERKDHTLQPTALVHEAYLRLAEQKVSWEGRGHFFAMAAQVMRHILVDHARSRRAEKRGGGGLEMTLDEAVAFANSRSIDLIALDEALTRLEALDPRQSRIVEMRFFAGLSLEDVAEELGISERTVKRDWKMARAWLHGELTR